MRGVTRSWRHARCDSGVAPGPASWEKRGRRGVQEDLEGY
jgi:hypothetical protein